VLLNRLTFSRPFRRKESRERESSHYGTIKSSLLVTAAGWTGIRRRQVMDREMRRANFDRGIGSLGNQVARYALTVSSFVSSIRSLRPRHFEFPINPASRHFLRSPSLIRPRGGPGSVDIFIKS